ncbi:MAG: RpiB/LacA/LacB family sugar-phosphate isomerase [Rickettsiales bacterium]|jgi:ribose 5-phosphate isomerase B|nr:RpiB/LacA/LacB family sugar-phosphate isomerase [Rickettsiales bacterium]
MEQKKLIAIGSDHGGYKLKELLKPYLADKGYDVADVGCYSEDSSDYPDMANKVADWLLSHPNGIGVLACRTGTGMIMAANRFRHVRAAMLYSIKSARLAREHEDANVAVLGSDSFGDEENTGFLDVFLSAEFTAEARHLRRIKKLS